MLICLVFGATFAASRPKGLQRLILASGLASKDLSIRSIQLRRGELPKDVLRVMEEYEYKQDCENPAYLEAQNVFNKTFVCRQEPPPAELLPAFKNLRDDKTVYRTMYVVYFPNLFYLFVAGPFRTALDVLEFVRAARVVEIRLPFLRRWTCTFFVRYTPDWTFELYLSIQSDRSLTKPFSSSGRAFPSMCPPARCSVGQAFQSCHRSPRQLLFTTESTILHTT